MVWQGKTYGFHDMSPPRRRTFFGAPHIKTVSQHMIKGQDSSNCIQTGEGSWKDKIIHFLPEGEPSSCGDEIQSEYFVPYDKLTSALEELYAIKDKFAHLV